MVRIAAVGPFALRPKGTLSSRVLPLARALQARGHRVRVVYPPWDNPEEEGRREVEGVEVVAVRVKPLLTLPLRLVSAALEFRPHVVHVFKPMGLSGLAGMIARFRVPLVVDMDDWEGWGGWNDRLPRRRWQKALFAWQERYVPPRAAAVTVASRHLETLAWSLGVAPGRTYYIPNGMSNTRWRAFDVPEASESRERLGLGEGPVVLLYTRFAEFHPERPLRVLMKVRERYHQAKLLVVGAGLRGEETILRRTASAAGLSEAIVETGWVSWEEVPRYLRLADVALLPMDDDLVNRTKCPVKVLDLMAARLPIVADAVGEAEEYLAGVGVLVPPGEVEAMGQAVVDLLSSPGRARRLGRAARDKVRRLYLWEDLAVYAEAAYRTATGPDSPPKAPP